MGKRILSIWLPRLAMDRLWRHKGDVWRSDPAVTVARSGSRILIAGANALAEGQGITPGQSLTDARAVMPGLRIAPADPLGDAAALTRLARWCERYTPWSAVDGVDGLFLDVTGCTHLAGGEAALLTDLARRLDAMSLAFRLALADTPGAAWAVARYGEDASSLILPGRQRDALAPLPVAALRLDPATVESLNRLGLRRIEDLRGMPRASLAARFGAGTVLRLDQASGAVEEPISPLRPAPRHRVIMRFPEPIARAPDIAAALDRLLKHLCRQLGQADEGARRFELTLFRVDHTTQTVAIGTGRAQRRPDRLKRLFDERFEKLDPGFGTETLLLAAHGVEPLDDEQAALPEADAHKQSEDLADLVDRLSNRLGPARVRRFIPAASHMPDRAFRSLPAQQLKTAAAWTRVGTPTRPLRVLVRPEPLEAVADITEATPPTTFEWRRRRHRLRHAEGPERILPEWWLGDGAWGGAPRDYWRIEDEAGAQLWLFREGGDGRPSRWFVQGMFG
jgi:protein ImuB